VYSLKFEKLNCECCPICIVFPILWKKDLPSQPLTKAYRHRRGSNDMSSCPRSSPCLDMEFHETNRRNAHKKTRQRSAGRMSVWQIVFAVLEAMGLGLSVFFVWMNTMKGGENPVDRLVSGLYFPLPISTISYLVARLYFSTSWAPLVSLFLASFVFGWRSTQRKDASVQFVFVSFALPFFVFSLALSLVI